jgi:hypothetical protein
MEDLLKKAADLFPAYLRDLIALITGPKRVVAHKLNKRSPLEPALLFLGISVAINFLLKLPLSEENPAIEILRTAAFSLVLWTLAGSVIWLAWRIVGGSGSLVRTLAIAYYYFGVLEFVMSLTVLAIVGALRTIDPGVYATLLKAIHEGRVLVLFTNADLADTAALRVALGIVVLGMMAALAWIVAGWGGFAAIHKLHGPRASVALVVAAVLWLPVWALTGVVAAAMAP